VPKDVVDQIDLTSARVRASPSLNVFQLATAVGFSAM
jgi:hypothetical protein